MLKDILQKYKPMNSESNCTIDSYGTKYWYKRGTDNLHRIDGPAIEVIDGGKFWYLNGLLHRTDGPAIECADGSKAWYLNGKQLTEEEWKKQVKLIETERSESESIKPIIKPEYMKYLDILIET